MPSNFLRINLNDLGKGCLVAIFSAVLLFVYNLLQSQGLAFTGENLQELLKIAMTALVAYLGKNLLTNNEGEFGKADR